MPAKNIIKLYVKNGYYHLYNRGVEKRIIFQDKQDYVVFMNYLKDYLLPKDTNLLQSILASANSSSREKDKALKLLRLNNFSNQIDLVAFCLMPNHFHFLLKQNESDSIDRFMQSIGTRYTMYFNKKYKRIGPLYQDVYKAVLVESDEQFLHLTRYIHKQALASQGVTLRSWGNTDVYGQSSSYDEFVGQRKNAWVKPEEVLAYFGKNNPSLSYEKFVKEQDEELISDVLLEEEE